MEVVMSTGAAKVRSNCYHQQTNTQLFTGRCPSCRPTNSVKALKGKYRHCLLNCNTVRVMSKVCRSATPDNLSNWISRCTPICVFSLLPWVDDALKLFARKEKTGSRAWRTRCEEQDNWWNVDRKWHRVHIIFACSPCSRVVKALVLHLVKPRSIPLAPTKFESIRIESSWSKSLGVDSKSNDYEPQRESSHGLMV